MSKISLLIFVVMLIQVMALLEDDCVENKPVETIESLRDYQNEQENSRVRNHYASMRLHQTNIYVNRMEKEFGEFNKANLTIREAFKLLESYVDASDPDVSLPNVVHNFMAAEAARKAGEPDWMQLTALLHDIGKLMFVWGKEEDGMSGRAAGPQWALGGDTWVLGLEIPDSAVYAEYNYLNEAHNACKGKCPSEDFQKGVMNFRFPWGHDEYAYRMLSHPKNGCKLPLEALQIIRLHSCYPLHTEKAYNKYLLPGDETLLETVVRFNRYDLYSKAEETIQDLERLWPYYLNLMDKYFERGGNGTLYF